MIIDINEIAKLAKEKYNLKQTPNCTKAKYRPARGETKTIELGIGSTLTVYLEE